MPKKTVSKTETEQVAPVVVAPVVDAAPAAAEKKTRKPKTVKAEAAAPAPVVEAAPAPAADATPAADAEAPLAEQSVEFLAKLQQLGTLINSIKSEYKALEIGRAHV